MMNSIEVAPMCSHQDVASPSVVQIANPSYRKRKAAVLELRQQQKQKTPKAAASSTLQEEALPLQQLPLEELPFIRVIASTAEGRNPRFEITAFVQPLGCTEKKTNPCVHIACKIMGRRMAQVWHKVACFLPS